MSDENSSSKVSTMPPSTGSGNRSISVGGGVSGGAILNAGDSNTITQNYQKTELPSAESVDIKAEIESLKKILASLGTQDQRKVDNALDEVSDEVAKPEPDKQEVATILERALGYAQKAEGFAKVIDSLKAPLTAIAAWLGAHYDTILGAIGLMA